MKNATDSYVRISREAREKIRQRQIRPYIVVDPKNPAEALRKADREMLIYGSATLFVKT